MKGLLSIFFVGIFIACSPSTQPTASSQKYDEDLSGYRPEVPEMTEGPQMEEREDIAEAEFVQPTEHIRTEIDSVLSMKAASNEDIGYLQGFTIQVYTGRSRDRANNAKEAVYEILIEESATVYYDQPMFRVKVGQYYTRLEAEKSLNLLKETFPQALVLPERIPFEE